MTWKANNTTRWQTKSYNGNPPLTYLDFCPGPAYFLLFIQKGAAKCRADCTSHNGTPEGAASARVSPTDDCFVSRATGFLYGNRRVAPRYARLWSNYLSRNPDRHLPSRDPGRYEGGAQPPEGPHFSPLCRWPIGTHRHNSGHERQSGIRRRSSDRRRFPRLDL